MIPISVLDLSPIVEGGTAGEALANTRDLARQAERLGYHRYWIAEHHNMPGIASAATAVVIGHVAAGTSTIRVGSGGIMLPNHAPLVIAEQFGTLASLFPGRIDLGIGRAPGTDQRTARALRRDRHDSVDTFPRDVEELESYFRSTTTTGVRAVPGAGLEVPIWLLGSSTYSAQLAAARGLPFAFASHFAPDRLEVALDLYRSEFRPSDACPRPRAMAAINVFAAASDQEAERLFTSLQQMFVRLHRGTPGPIPPPVDNMDGRWSPAEAAGVAAAFREAIVGSEETVRDGLRKFLARTRVDELMVTAMMYDHAARVRSFELTAKAAQSLG